MTFTITRRETAPLALAALIPLIAAGCSSSGANGETGKLTVWTWNAPGDGLEAAIPEFTTANPDIEVEVLDVGNPAIWDKVTSGMAAGGAGLPDIINIGIDYMGNYVEKFPDQLVDLGSLGADSLEADFPPGAWKSGCGPDGTVYGIPYEVNATGFFYRNDLFEAAGVDVQSIATWDDLIDAGVTIKEATGAAIFTMDKAGTVADSAGLWQLLTMMQGAFYFDADGNITLNGPEGLRSLELIKKANDLDLITDVPGSWENTLKNLRGERDVAALNSGGWLAGVMENEAPDMAGKWGVRTPPSMEEGGLTAAINGGTYLSIAASSTKQAAAWKFIEFALGTLEGQKLVYEGGGMFPGFLPLLNSDGFSEPSAYFNDVVVNQIFTDQLEQDTPSVNYSSDYARALKSVVDAQTRVLLSGADPQESLDKAAEELAQQTGRETLS